MTTTLTPDLCVIGAGSGGLSVAAGAAAFGVPVVLIEKGRMGGDCLNYGCVPSKALIAAARRAQAMRQAAPFGLGNARPRIDFEKVHDHVHGVIAAIAPNDSVERFTGLGVKVIAAPARFLDATTVAAGEYRVKARRFVVATGSSPAVPAFPGLDDVPYLTNETVFDLKERPDHLIVIGGGPIGIELAQAFRRLGAEVSVIEMASPLGRDDPELAGFVLRRLAEEGVTLHAGAAVTRLEKIEAGVRVLFGDVGAERAVEGSHVLIAVGRRPNVADLGLEAAGIDFDRRGIAVDRGLKTSNRRVYAIGDVTGGLQFTHVANDHAGIVIRNALFRLPAKARTDHIPRVTYADPELAQVGLTEADAAERHRAIRVLRWPYAENDRAQAEHETEGLIKVVTDAKGRILGAGIVGAHAGELIQIWSLAIAQKLPVRAMTGWVSPYPTLGEIGKRAAIGYYRGSVTNPMVRRVIGFLRRFG